MDTNLTLAQIRRGLKVSQAVMAEAMGVPLRTYEDLEAGRAATRPVHLQAASYATLTLLAAGAAKWEDIPPSIQEGMRTAAALVPPA